jgi:hypothetical protein
LVHNLFKSPASCNSIPARQQKPYFNINPQKLLFCCFTHHEPMIYISFDQSPKHATQLEHQAYSKKFKCWHLSFWHSWILHLFSIVGSNLSYTDGPQQYQFFTPLNYFLTKKDKRDWSQKTKGASWIVAAFLFLCYYFSLSL